MGSEKEDDKLIKKRARKRPLNLANKIICYGCGIGVCPGIVNYPGTLILQKNKIKELIYKIEKAPCRKGKGPVNNRGGLLVVLLNFLSKFVYKVKFANINKWM